MSDSLRVVKIVLTGSYSLPSLIIMLSTRSKFSHAGFVLSDGTFLDAHPRHGVSIRELPAKTAICKEYDVKDPNIGSSIFYKAKSQLKKNYDWQWIFSYPFKRNWQDPEDWVCFEFVAWTIKNVIGLDKSLHRITGRHLERALDRWVNA